jgi:Flp pilus assembly protein TadG
MNRLARFARLQRLRDDTGTAALEFITVGLILLVPLVYLVLALAALQAGTLAVEGAARQAARVFVQAPTAEEAAARAARAIEFGLADYGMDGSSVSTTVRCSGASACPARNALVTVTVRVTVPLPLVPDVLDLSSTASVPIEASASQRVSRFWTGQ